MKVKNYIYAVEQSLDNYKFNLLKNKQTFISQMKNCELNVRTIDEGAIDEKSGMNFSEYIAILSGDTSLLEKSKMEKKIAVLESLKGAHFRESSRSKWQLERLDADKKYTLQLLEKVSGDETLYKSHLQFEKDGTKCNPVQIDGYTGTNAEDIGKYLINFHKQFKIETGSSEQKKIGNLYGFDLNIRANREFSLTKGEYIYHTEFYAESPVSGLKYFYNQGQPNIDNPKLAARHFLNSIDRVVHLKDQHLKTLEELERNIPLMEQVINKPFEKEEELKQLKLELSRLEREIAIKIQENQMKQANKTNEDITEPEEMIEVEVTGILIESKKINGKINHHTIDDDLLVKNRVRNSNGLKL